jgi:uncharacterized protein YkwD
MLSTVVALVAAVNLLSAVSIGPGSPAPAKEPLVRISPTVTVVTRVADATTMLATINAERASRGVAALAIDARLSALALAHADDMGRRSYFGHETPEGLTPFQRMDVAHYPYSYAGENVALDQSVGAADNAFWNSTDHRANILQTHFGRIGLAAVAVADGELFVEEFSD